MKYTLRQLEVFLETARHENLSRAAATLAMSQSAASDALRELEQQFDVLLFDRVGRRIQLNDFGRLLLPRAEELLDRAQELEILLGRHQAHGPIRVGATLSIGNYLCIPLIKQYREKYPDSPVSLEVDNTEHIASKVTHYELDVGMIEGEVNDPALEITRWDEDELIVFARPDHPLAHKGLIDVEDILQESWILREKGSGTRQTFDRVMHDQLSVLRIGLELEHTEAIKRAVEAGMGLGCLSKVTLVEAFASGRFVPLAIRGRKFKRNFYLIMHRHKYRTAAIQHWLELCMQVIK